MALSLAGANRFPSRLIRQCLETQLGIPVASGI